MPYFSYIAIDASGRKIKSGMEADSEQNVLAKLRDQSLHCTEIKQTKKKGKQAGSKRKAKLKTLVVFSRQFATMIDAGIPILRCLEITASQTKEPSMKAAIEEIMADVKGGLTLNEAMAKHPHIFSKLFVNMVKAAEAGGILDQILERLANFLEAENEIRGKIKGALTYPILVLVFSQVMLFVMFSFVLPKFKSIFAGMNVTLPSTTQALFGFGDFMNKFWWVVLLVFFGSIIGLKLWGKTATGRWQMDFIKLKTPVVGGLILKMSVSRFCRTFGTLINSGVPVMRGLEITGETLNNVVLAHAIDQTRNSIREGNRLSIPLQKSGLFPTMVTTMIDIGEESGRLSEMLVKIGDFYDKEVESAVKGLTSLIEPALIMFMGGIVGFIVISIMSPMFKLVSHIH